MRPKIVILILAAAIGLIALAAVLKAVKEGGEAPQQAKAPGPPVEEPAPATPAMPRISPNSSNTAAMLEQLRAQEMEKQLDQVRQAQADGALNPQSTALLLRQVMSQESEVRNAALEALVQLNDTNAIPGLEEATAFVNDPGDKAAILQAIEYLKTPSAMDGSPPPPEMMATYSNYLRLAKKRPIRPNPAFQRGATKNKWTRAAAAASAAQPAAPGYPAQPQTQPGSTAPDTTPSATPPTTPPQ
jgi:hypothetical protein